MAHLSHSCGRLLGRCLTLARRGRICLTLHHHRHPCLTHHRRLFRPAIPVAPTTPVDTKPLPGTPAAIQRIWPGLSDADVRSILEHTETAHYDPGETVFAEGQTGSHFFLILEGAAAVVKAVRSQPSDGPATDELVRLITLHPGDIAGESTLFEDVPLNASLVADVPTRLARISIPAFRSLIHSNQALAAAIFKSLSAELRRFRSSLGRAALSSPERPHTSLCVFDFKPHEKDSFEKAVASLKIAHPVAVRYIPVKLSSETAALAVDSQIVCIFVNDVANADVLTRLANIGVRCIALRCAGFNNVDLKAARALGIEVVRVPAYSPYAVAEHAVALALALNRKIVHAYSRVKQGNFSLHNLVGFDLHGKTIGVIGTGKIGQCFIKIMLGFGCTVLCHDVYRSAEVASWPNARYVDSLDELYAKSKIISLHCPLLPSTKYMINAESVAKMQPGVMIINTSRGPLINTRDLIEGLKSGHIGSAGLDVYEEESAYFFEDMSDKIMTDDVLARLLTFNNVIVTSHQAFLTEEALHAIAETTTFNIGQFLEGKTGSDLTNNVSA